MGSACFKMIILGLSQVEVLHGESSITEFEIRMREISSHGLSQVQMLHGDSSISLKLE